MQIHRALSLAIASLVISAVAASPAGAQGNTNVGEVSLLFSTPSPDLVLQSGSLTTATGIIVGATPTAGALEGAIARARAHASENPNHKVVAVLATDGLPTRCDPTDADDLADIAREGVNGAPSVSTFVIGVFEGDNTSGHETMNRIAEGGGTTSAFMIDTGTDVSQAFLDALNEIRGRSLACEYQVPTPSDGQSLDYGTLNVEHTPPDASEPTTVFYVADEASCDATAGGWYYDIDPSSGGTPTKVVMCPATCTRFQAGGEVALRVGCKTAVPPPPR